MAVLIERTTAIVEGCYEVHLDYDNGRNHFYLVPYSDCCNKEFLDLGVGEKQCICGSTVWSRGEPARFYLTEGDTTGGKKLKEWLSYWIVGQSNGIEVNIEWE